MGAINPQFAVHLPSTLVRWQAGCPDARRVELEGAVLSADVAGFTALVERHAQEGRVGAETVTLALNDVFAELLAIVADEGGDVLTSGGDGVVALFEGSDGLERAATSAVDMQEAVDDLGPEGIAVAVGIEGGSLTLGLAEGRHLIPFVLGPAVRGALAAEASAAAGEVRVGPRARDRLDSFLVDGRLAGGVSRVVNVPSPPTAVSEQLDLGRYVPPSVAPLLTLAGSGGTHRSAAVGFVHVRGTEADVDDIRSTIARIDDEVGRFGVTLLAADADPGGVKLLLTAGVPVIGEHDDEALLRALDAVTTACGHAVRCGAATGDVFVGDLGAPSRRTYTVMGATVNLAARLAAKAAPGETLTTLRTIGRAKVRFAQAAGTSFRPKGFAAPIAPIVLGPPLGERARARDELPLVGREEELARLTAGARALVEGQGSAVEIVGDAGVGKSRLVAALVDGASVDRILTVRCDPYEVDRPYAAVGRLLRQVLDLAPAGGEPSAVDAGVVTDAVARAVPHLSPWSPLLSAPLGVDIEPTAETTRLGDRFRRERLHRTIDELLAGVLSAPSIVVVEDVHWLDPASATVVERLASATAHRSWMLVVATRPPGRWGEDADRIVLDLEPLDRPSIMELLRVAARMSPTSDRTLDRIAARSGGHPLFALELLRAGSDDRTPGSLEAIVGARIDRLDPRDRRLVEAAAVLGSSFPVDLLAETLPDAALEDAGTWERLAELLGVSVTGTVGFTHDIVRTVAYEGQSERSRRALHALAADAIERRHRRRPERAAADLARHHGGAGNHAQTWRFALLAAEQARRALAPEEALGWFEMALDAAEALDDLDPVDVARAVEAMGEVAALAGRPDVARHAFDEAERRVASAIDRARILRKRAGVQINADTYEDALPTLRRALALLEGVHGEPAGHERAELLLAEAGLRYRQGDAGTARDLAAEAMEVSDAHGHAAGIAHADYLLVVCETQLGVRVKARGRTALRIYEELGDLAGLGATWNNLGVRAYYDGDWSAAVEAWTRAAEASAAAGDAIRAAIAVNNAAEVLSDQGSFGDARERFEDALRAFEAADYPTGRALALSNLGRALCRDGDRGEGRTLLEMAEKEFQRLGASLYAADATLRRAEAHLLEGDDADAERVLATFDDGHLSPGARSFLHRLEAILAARAGDEPEALRKAQAALDAAREEGVVYEEALCLDLVGRLTGADDLVAEADRLLGGLDAAGATRIPVGPS